MKYIDAEKLIAEIERRIESWTIRGKHSPAGQGRDTCDSRVTELSNLLSFVTSLQKEQQEEELNEETIINEFRIIGDKCFNEGIKGWQREKLIARHFAEWGANHLNARKEESK